MSETISPSVSTKLTHTTLIAPQLRHSLKLLAMGLPELRAELQKSLAENPVLEDVKDSPDDSPDETMEFQEGESDSFDEESDGSEEPVDELGVAYLQGVNRGTVDAAAIDRRDRFFNNQVLEESLEEHLLRQVPVSDIDEADYPLAETLIGELDDDGYFRGSLGEIAEVAGESEAKLRSILKRISFFDPPGCGATSLKECLEPQLDTIRNEVLRRRVEGVLPHLTDLAFMHRVDAEVLAALRTLEPRPGRIFSSSRDALDYVHPEVEATPDGAGSWRIRVDTRDLPVVRIAKRYLELLENPRTDEKTRAYVRERIAAARLLIDAVDHRQQTIERIVGAILASQPDFLRGGMSALKPLTMQQIGRKAGVHHTTVSRTVRGKYVSTPHGVFELRRFFTTGVAAEGGVTASVTTVLMRLKAIVDAEDLAHPFSDEALSNRLKELGFDVARRTIAKYRTRLGIPSAFKRAVK